MAALAAHGVDTRLLGRTVGPSVTRYELELGAGVKVARVTSLSKDIAYAMASPDVRILAPIPGKSAIGVEVPNRRRELVALGDVLSSPRRPRPTIPSKWPLDVTSPVGRSWPIWRRCLTCWCGATGSGKSSCINSLLTSILTRATPDQVRPILVDPKRVELGQYNDLPHLLTQVVVDPKKAANALSWAVTEMERRYDLLAEVGMRDITGYNCAFDDGELADYEEAYQLRSGEPERTKTVPEVRSGSAGPLPAVALHPRRGGRAQRPDDGGRPGVEDSVCRIAQMARAVGIHLVLATQRPVGRRDHRRDQGQHSLPVGLFGVHPGRQPGDPRSGGAERLIGKGDMLLLSASSSNPQRLQGPWVSEEEVRAVAAHWKRQRPMEVVAGIEEVVGEQ